MRRETDTDRRPTQEDETMPKHMSHDGTVESNEVMSPGYLRYRCDAWGLPPQSSGWHNIYCPLRSDIAGHEIVTDAMREAAREHYRSVNAAEVERKAASKAAYDAHVERLRSIDVPAEAISAYRRYGGDVERADRAEDTTSTDLLRKYGDAIEAQKN